jgi:uncharacterized HAD superfamily protein
MRIAIDIDGTICNERPTFDKPMAEPFEDAKQEINAWHEKGFEIIFFTARGWEQYNITEHWLQAHGFKYDRLICGKPIYDKIIDDRSQQPTWGHNDSSE